MDACDEETMRLPTVILGRRVREWSHRSYLGATREFIRTSLNSFLLNRIGMHLSALPGVRTDLRPAAYDYEELSGAHIVTVKHHTLVSVNRLLSLYEQVRYIEANRIPGDFVECGVWRGGAAAMMALAQMDSRMPPRLMRLFDSFVGLPKATSKDSLRDQRILGLQRGQHPEQSGLYAASAEHVRRLLDLVGYPSEYVDLHVGWFQDTIAGALKRGFLEKIALLRLDGDLYESTRVCLETLWPRVVKGGVMIIDDYRSFDGCTRAVDEYFGKGEFTPLLHHIPRDGGRYIVKISCDSGSPP